MKIKSITVGGFRNLKRTKIDLGGISALVSLNNCGKTNLLDSIKFGIDFIKKGSFARKFVGIEDKPFYYRDNSDKDNYYFQIEFYDENLNDYCWVRYGYIFNWGEENRPGKLIKDEWLDLKGPRDRKFSSYMKREEGKYKKGKNARIKNAQIKLNETQLAIDILSAFEDIEIYDVIKSILNLNFYICKSLDIEKFKNCLSNEISGLGENKINYNNDDVPQVLHFLRKNYKEEYKNFEDAILTIFPEFSGIELIEYEPLISHWNESQSPSLIINDGYSTKFDQSIRDSWFYEKNIKLPYKMEEKKYSLLAKRAYSNKVINIESMSNGTKRIFWLLSKLYISACAENLFLGIEEIEGSIHPKLLKNLLEIIDESLGDGSVILSSHSPYLVQYLKPSHIYIGIQDFDGNVVFRKIKKTKANVLTKMAREFGFSVGEYLFELMSGDSDEIKNLQNYLEEPVSYE